MKPLYTRFALVILILFAQKASAQNMNARMNAVNNMWNKQFTQSQMQMQMQNRMNMGFLSEKGGGRSYNFDYVYVITMADSSKRQVYSKIYLDTTKHKTYVLFLDRNLPKNDPNKIKKIYSDETLSLERNLAEGEVEDKWYKGMAKDSCWMFKVISGPINAYSLLSEEDNTKFMPETLVGIQKGDGPILKVSAENLMPMVEQNADAFEYAKTKNYYEAIKKYNQDIKENRKK
ncbi:hypothetical protein [Mucilaginibacter sp. 22184]|uniref:hypothetical protein n=1 Tax=Mucilaginibacter sp. 22184 TaxID=3453887 RepID=UPI003F82B24C